MAKKIENPLFRGRVGNLVYYVRNGEQMVRALPQTVKNPQTPKQQANRARLKASCLWLSPIKNVLRMGFPKVKSGSAYSHAHSLLLRNAIVDGAVDASKAQVAEGTVVPMAGGSLQAEGRQVSLRWTDNTAGPHATVNDLLVYLFYNPQTKMVVSNYQHPKPPRRNQCACTVTLPHEAEGTFHVYAFFHNHNRSDASSSVYLGEVRV